VHEGSCGFGDNVLVDECLLPNEVGYAEPQESVALDEAGEPYVEGKDWFGELEVAVCTKVDAVNDLCEEWITSCEYVLGEGPCDDPGFEAPGFGQETEDTTTE
jgi:hypothetical protein